VRYWDSSALVPLLVAQPASGPLEKLFRADPEAVAWWGSEVECASALARLERENRLTTRAAGDAFQRLDQLARGWHTVEPLDRARETARRLLRTHDLRAADALQLAAALLASEGRPSTLEFVSLDRRLLVAAGREGFPTLGDDLAPA
jgi:predicted nucleic acid-binding protein